MKMRLLYIFILFLAGISGVRGQNLEYGVILDTNYMLVGDQQNLTFKVTSDKYIGVQFPLLKDTVTEGIEIISGPHRDSVKNKNGHWTFEERYVITVFDTGVYMIPPMRIALHQDDYNNVLTTEPVGVAVNTFQIKDDNQYRDIVMPHKAPITFAEILPYLLYFLLGLVLITLLVFLIIRITTKKPLIRIEKRSIPPYEKAMSSLEHIKAEKLWQAGKIKEYYSRLTDTVRLYLEEELKVNAMEQTTFETLSALENNKYIDKAHREQLSEMLQEADLVKFAKMTPLPDENTRNLDRAYHILEHVNGNIKTEQQMLEEQKKREKTDNTEKES